MSDPIIWGDLVRGHGRRRPDAIACRAGERRLTFGELDLRSDRVAAGLAAAGLGPGARVAVLAKNGVEFVEVLCGCLKAGAVLAPLNWRLAPAELAAIIAHSQAEALFVEEGLMDLVAGVTDALPTLRAVVSIGGADGGYEAWLAQDHAPLAPRLADPAEIIVQMYTSGTTGLPKGVQLSHANYAAAMQAANHYDWGRCTPEEIIFAPAPFFHVNGLNLIMRSLMSGAQLITVDQFRPAAAIEVFEQARVTRATLAPAMLQMCLEAPGVRERDFSALRLITYGGSPISQRVLNEARAVFGCGFAQGYGMTETSGAACMLAPEDHAEGRGKLASCGRPLPGVAVQVVDPAGAPCPPGAVGEVVIRAAGVTAGYFRDPEATARTIRDGWLHTGDAGYFDDEGYLYIHDRVKDMIVSGAENIYPAEVENALFQNPAIADAAVIGVPDERWGEAVKALVVLRPGAAADAAQIIAGVRREVAAYKAPKSVEFVGEIPRNAAGKILRRELRAPYWAGRERAVN